MSRLFLRKAMGVVIAFVTLITLAPQAVFAASLGAPTNVTVVGGQYTNDATPSFTWDRPAGATWFEYAIDSVANDYALGNVGSYTSSTTLSNGWHTFYVWAHDNAGNQSAYASVVFEIDTVGPTVPAVSPSTATEGEAVTFSVYPYGESTPTSCVLYVEGASAGAMSKNGSTFTKSYTFAWDGIYTVYARCTDGDGNSTSGSSRTVTVNNKVVEDTFIIPAVSPSSATEDTAVTFSVTPYGTLDATSCKLYVSGASVGSMSASSGTFSKSYTFSNAGTYTVYAYCEDENGDWTWGTSRNVSVEKTATNAAPTVPAVYPSTAIEDEKVEISVKPTSDERVSWCDLYVDGSNVGDMYRETDGTFTLDYTFVHDGTFTVYATCTDASYDTTQGTSRTVRVDTRYDYVETFIIPAVSPSSATEDKEVTFEVTPYGDLEAESCKLYVSGSSVGVMSEYRGEFTRDYTFSNDGSYTVYAYCEDENGDWTKGTSRTVTVSNQDDDEFVVPAVSPSSATEDEAVTFKVTPYGDLDAESCKLYVDGSNAGTMSESSGTFSKSYTFSNDGSYTVYAYCEDENGDWTKGTSRTVEVENENNDGTLSVPKVTPSSADEDEETEFTVRPTSNKNVTDCWLYVDDVRVETMDEESTNVFVAEYTFRNSGSYDVHAYCKDSSGDTATGAERTVTVGDDDNDDVERGSLIKTDCGTSTSVSDPCRAVYYYDERGERHAFPNETTFYSWFKNFDDVIIVSKSFMSSLPLGENVTYRPGSVLVKFTSSSKVYAVEAERTLRHYETLSLLESDYGSDWSKSLVSLPDTLYKNYDLGRDIDSKTDFDRTEAYYSVDSIEDIF